MTVDEIQKQILADFDFELVKAVMTAIGWKWSLANGDFRVPTEDEMKAFALRLIRDVVDGAERTNARFGISSGGFCVVADGGKVSLDFVVESAEVITREF